MNNSFIAGVDIGGSHITASLVNVAAGALLPDSVIRAAVAPDASAEEVIDTWCYTIEKSFGWDPVGIRYKKIGMAMPGPFDYEKGISYIRNQSKYESLYGLNVKELMAEKLQIDPGHIRMMNDALCFLQGEILGGAVTGYNSALGLTLGTGLGSAVYRDGQSTDADLWHTPFRNTIAEDYLSSRWLVNRYQELYGVTVNNTRELTDRIPSDPSISQIFEEFGDTLAEFLQKTIHLHQPEVIVLGGNISRSARLFLPALEKGLKRNDTQIPIRMALLGEHAHMIGAAGCWRQAIM